MANFIGRTWQQGAIVSEEPQSEPKTPVWHYVVVACAVLVGIVMVGVLSRASWQASSAKKMFQSFTRALVAKDYAGAYQLTSPSFRTTTHYIAFEETYENLTAQLGDLKRVSVSRFDVNEYREGWFGTVDADLVFANGDLRIEFTLKKEDGAWKIYRYREP